MPKCDNCENEFHAGDGGLTTTAGNRIAAAICGACLNDVTLVKLVLRKRDLGGFSYEQYVPLEMRKPDKAAG